MKSPPLYETVDVTGIEDVFFGPNNETGSRRGLGSIEFRYAEYRSKVRSDGWIHVYEPTEAKLV